MINFKKQDPVADSIKTILEKKELSPKQKAIAKMSPPAHKIDAGDLAKLRAGHKPVKSEGMDEEIDPKKTVTDTLRGREKKSDNPFLSKKVFMDVPGDVKEEAEQIDELKKSTVKSYIAKKSEKLPGKDPKKDMKSMMSAHHRITGVKPTSEGLTLKKFKELNEGHSIFDQMINEVLSKDASAGDWIHDFVHSDNPKFKGKSKEMRKKMALAAYYAKQRNEEVEQIDEAISIKKDYDDHEQSEHGVYSGKRKIGYVVHDKKTNTHTAYHGHKYGKDDYENIDDFHSHESAVNQIKHSAGIKEEIEQIDELSKSTLTSYASKARSDSEKALKTAKSMPRTPENKFKNPDDYSKHAKLTNKAFKRSVGADSAEIKASMKKEEMDESSNPFSPDYKSQMPSKPGEKAGFTSKKISTGTVFTKKYKKDDSEEEKKK